MKTTSRMKMTLKNEDGIKNEDALENEDILKNEDNTKMSKTLTTLPEQIFDDSSALLTQNLKCYQLSKPEIELNVIKEMYVAMGMHTCLEKTTFKAKTTKS